jgi:hypothetical protein
MLRLLSTANPGRPWLLAFVFLVMLLTGAAAPRPAWAQDCCSSGAAATWSTWLQEKAEMLKEITIIGDMLNIIQFFFDAFKDFVKLFGEKIDLLTATVHIDQSLQSVVQLNLAKQQVGVTIDSTINGVVTQTAVDRYRNPYSKVDCYTYLMRQGLANFNFTSTVANALLEMTEKRYLGPDRDGNGPQWAADAIKGMGCSPSGDVPANYPRGIPSASVPPDSCKDTTGKYEGLLTSSRLISGAYTLEVPPFKPQTIVGPKVSFTANVPNPDPNNQYQMWWMAAAAWLNNLVGARPTPPSGAAILTPEGIAASAQWNHCASVESALAKQCADLIAKYTRPNCNDANERAKYRSLCDLGYQTCNAAAIAGIKISDYPDINCVKGLSKYQFEFLANLVCLTSETAKQHALGGASTQQNTQANNQCAIAWMTWQDQLISEQNACSEVAAKLAKLDCWPDVKSYPTIK